MKTLGVVAAKGGVGKSTTAVTLAALLAEDNRVLLADADVDGVEGSSAWWAGREGGPLAWAGMDVTETPDAASLRGLGSVPGYDWLVLDSPPVLGSEALQAVCDVADVLVIPTGTSPLDLRKLLPMVQALPAGTQSRVLLTRVHPSAARTAQQAQEELTALGLAVLPTVVRAYAAHTEAAARGVPVTRAPGATARKAEGDYRNVLSALLQTWPVTSRRVV